MWSDIQKTQGSTQNIARTDKYCTFALEIIMLKLILFINE